MWLNNPVGPHRPAVTGGILLVVLLGFGTPGKAASAGERIFVANCEVCHQADGRGVAGLYPPVAESIGSYVALPQGRAYLVHVVSFGMMGPVSAHGRKYDGFMQSWTRLSDQEIAQVLNYVLTNFNRDLLPKAFAPISGAEAKELRAGHLTFEQVHADREALMKALSSKSK